VFPTELSMTAHPQGIHTNIRIYLIFLETRIIGLHSAANDIGLSSLKFVVGCEILFHFCKSDVSAVQGHPRSLSLVPIEST